MITHIRMPRNYATTVAVIAVITLIIMIICLAMGDLQLFRSGIVVLFMVGLAGWLAHQGARQFFDTSAQTQMVEAMRSTMVSTGDEDITTIDKNISAEKKNSNISYHQTTIELLRSDLRSMDIKCQSDGEDMLVFRYQGGYFHASSVGDNMVRIVFPRIFTADIEQQDFICRLLNRINASYAVCKMVTNGAGAEPILEIHSFADIYYTEYRADRIEALRDIFAVFFEQQRSLLIAVSQSAPQILTAEMEDSIGFDTSYKDISLN